jgi:type II secretory ATPase GspE/PulE/Tfp pilus assembly ATPase PilB-like protein
VSDMLEPIGQILIKKRKVTQAQVEEALAKQKTVRRKLGELLVMAQALAEDDVLDSLSLQIQIPLADRRLLQTPSLDLVRLVPEPFARENGLLPLRKQDGKVEAALADPEDLATIDNLKRLVKAEIVPLLAGRAAIEAAISKAYESIRKTGEVDTVMSGLEFEIRDAEGGEPIDLSLQKEVDDAPVVKLVNLILTQALKDRATDIHVEPYPDRITVRYRVDGALLVAMTAPIKSHPGVVSRIKIMSKLNIAENRLPQDGRFSLRMTDREVDVRVSILPSVLGEKIVMRLLDKGFFDLSLANLGFEAADLALFRRAIRHPYGIIVISGPTGSGKSTSLYSAVKEIKSVEDNIVTVEDPVEYQMEGITQVAANDAIGLTFANSLRSILRQDPDKVLIGEIRDRETADIALKLALTGHLVFTTLHANDAPSTITRLVDIGVPSYLAGSSLVLVMSQRLVRKLCGECKESYVPSAEEWEQLALGPQEKPRPIFRGRGCPKCRETGYYGRIGIFELMTVGRPIRTLILAGADQEAIRQEALAQGMRTLRRSALEKLFAGVTSLHEVLKTTVEEG